ncbi:MAG TPA: hypothetical protein VII32_09600 [Thermoanaerobaculia bacterium]
MKLFLQILGFVLMIVALVLAKRRFLDKPPAEPAAIETTTSKADSSPPPAQPATASETEEGRIATLLNRVFHGGNSGTPEDKARIRMKAFMQAWKEGGTSLGDAEQAAACLWSRGKIFIPDRDEIQDAYNGFTKFRRDKDLYTTIKEYAIADTIDRAHDEAHGDYSTFAVTIDGKTYLMGVPDKSNPIFWIR